MVIDTSAIFAAVVGETDSGIYRNAIVSAPLRIISAVTRRPADQANGAVSAIQ
jgi:uncharacterized protein with PIN domain